MNEDKTDETMVKEFWSSPDEAFFGQESIAAVIHKSIKTLESDRWLGKGAPYRKVGGRVLYRKVDVVKWIEGYKLVKGKGND